MMTTDQWYKTVKRLGSVTREDIEKAVARQRKEESVLQCLRRILDDHGDDILLAASLLMVALLLSLHFVMIFFHTHVHPVVSLGIAA